MIPVYPVYWQRLEGMRLQVADCQVSCEERDGNPDETYILKQETMQFLFAVLHTHSVTRIDYPNYRIRLLKVVSPIWTERPLSADIPCSWDMNLTTMGTREHALAMKVSRTYIEGVAS